MKQENQEFNWMKLTLGVLQRLDKLWTLSLPQSTHQNNGDTKTNTTLGESVESNELIHNSAQNVPERYLGSEMLVVIAVVFCVFT